MMGLFPGVLERVEEDSRKTHSHDQQSRQSLNGVSRPSVKINLGADESRARGKRTNSAIGGN